MTSVRLLLSGDLHLGRSSSRVGQVSGTSARDAWERLVDAAIARDVDIVCLSGDIADADNRFWEAIGPLRDGINRLAESSIVTVAVSGNHDYDVLPRLAAQLDSDAFHLLGQDGNWERYVHERDGATVLHIDGWSFTQQVVTTSPLGTYALDSTTVPTIGIVHGDLDVPASRYAPLERAALQRFPFAAWLLGHIHAPMCEQSAAQPLLLYPGSPQALDPGETGAHGAWILELRDGQVVACDMLPLSSVRYDQLEIDLDGIDDLDAARQQILKACRQCAVAAASEGGGHLEQLALRVQLRGRSALAATIDADMVTFAAEFTESVDGVDITIERVSTGLRPALDLEALASSQSMPGRLANLILALDAEADDDQLDDDVAALLADVTTRVERQRSIYPSLTSAESPAQDTAQNVRWMLRREAERLLATLEDQKA